MAKTVQASLDWLENPGIFRVGRLDAHSDHCFYETEEDMQCKNETLRQSLNGTWKFFWSRNPKERPCDFYREDADLAGFGEIRVPGHMELQGYGQIHYINTMYPWEGHAFLRPPHIDWEENPVGSYVKEFDLNKEFLGKRVCISFQGAEQAIYVWLNGVFIGYAEDSFTPSEFDLTDVIREKENRLCVEVYKRSSAAWLEDQDFFRFSGLFREVFLYAKPESHIEDLWIKAGAREDFCTGTLEIRAKVSGEPCKRISWELLDKQGKTAGTGLLYEKKEPGKPGESILAEEGQLSVWEMEQWTLQDVSLWDVGKPELYQVILRLFGKEGNLTEIVPYQIGFRRFEIRDGIMQLNGKRLLICGVNRHEWNPHTGRAITAEDMKRDIEIMKRNHINAVRTCHYPDQSLWYRLCDEAGICVMDEANLESHGSWQKMGQCEPSWNVPGSCMEWEACVLDRASSMLERDKNHPSVLWWSCGNESYAGECIRSMSRYFCKKDPSRLVHYEGVYWNREFDDISDVESRMYASPKDVRAYLENSPAKPFLLCEFMHDMGNSIGGMGSYMKLFEEFPMYQGGFIWDYIDQALWHENVRGEQVLGYGGDFGDRPTDYAFSANGILFADRKEKPAMQEVRYWYSSPKERKAFDEKNKRAYEEAVRDRKKTEEKGLACADECNGKKLQIIHGDVMLGVKGEDFQILFSRQDGGPVSLKYDGKECLYRAPRPAFWRASTENDRGNGFASKSAGWLSADLFSTCSGCRAEEYDGEKVRVTYTYCTSAFPEAGTEISYTVDGSGRIRVELRFQGREGLPELPLFGLRIVMPEYTKTVKWQGLSGETYPDRMAGGVFGEQESEVEVPDYLVPQECGNHMLTCRMETGPLYIVMDKEPFAFSALPYSAAELENALHRDELPSPGRTVVTVLARMRGVGGIDSWGADVEEPYHISAENDITFSFYIMKKDD